jgi:hypothetical protein
MGIVRIACEASYLKSRKKRESIPPGEEAIPQIRDREFFLTWGFSRITDAAAITLLILSS